MNFRHLTFCLSLVLILGINGCKTLTSQEGELESNADLENIVAAPSLCEVANIEIDSIEDCIIAKDGVIEVMHPQEEVAVDIKVVEPTPVVIENLWFRAKDQFNFTIPQNRRVEVQKNWYLKNPAYMARVTKRAKPFLYYIVTEIEKRDMPLELALLPIVESAFDPFAYSHGRAAGMWQFIPSTAQRFGIKQTWWYDGRRDAIASTQGALDYLTYLHKLFDGNWLHALAAYNSGEGRVKRAIKRNKKENKPTSFWDLSLPKETRAYVPKLLALADILKNSDEYKFAWPTIENNAVIDIVDIGSQIDLALAAELADMKLQNLHALNPGFNRWATDPNGPHYLVLPLDKVSHFKSALAKIENKERLNWVRHKVKSGDSLLKLAKKYHTTSHIIQKVNKIKGNMIRVGDYLMVPVALKSLDSYSLSADQRLVKTQNKKRGAYQISHTVKSGDTFWDLSRKYQVNTRELAKWNGMAPTDPLMPGKRLTIWVKQASSPQARDAIVRTLTYTVKNGDSLSRIANKFNVSTKDITKWNNLNPKRYLQPGQKLKLFVDVTRLANVS